MRLNLITTLLITIMVLVTINACNRNKGGTATPAQEASQTETAKENTAAAPKIDANLSATDWVVAEPLTAGDQTWKTKNLTATWNRGTLTISGTGAIADTNFSSDYYNGNYPWQDPHLEVYQLIIENGITEIGYLAFNGKELSGITIPDSVSVIGADAFCGNQLTKIIIPDGVNRIWGNAFTANQLTSITIGANVEIGHSETGGFEGAVSVYLEAFDDGFDNFYNNGGKRAGTYTLNNGIWSFEGTAITAPQTWQLGGITVTLNGGTLTINGSGELAGEYRGGGGDSWYIYPWNSHSNEFTSVIIGNGITTIGDMAFSGNQLTSITIPNSVTTIKQSAFSVNQLTNVTIPNSVTSIERDAFFQNQLTHLTIGNSVTSIEASSFAMNQLTSVTIPDSVTKIGGWAFGRNPLTSITIGANVELGGYSAPDAEEPVGAFDDGFDNAYNEGGKQAGTYKLNNGVWSKQ